MRWACGEGGESKEIWGGKKKKGQFRMLALNEKKNEKWRKAHIIAVGSSHLEGKRGGETRTTEIPRVRDRFGLQGVSDRAAAFRPRMDLVLRKNQRRHNPSMQ